MSISKVVKLGVVGGGVNSAVGRAHMSALRMDGRFEIKAACFSKDGTLNQKSQESYLLPNVKLFKNEDELIYNSGVDVILLLSPTPQHAQQVLKVLGNRMEVISEKALCTSFNEVNQIRDALDKSDKKDLSVTLNYSGYPMVREIAQRIHNKSLGDLLTLRIEMPQETFLRNSKLQNWRSVDYSIPTITLDLGVHVFHLVRFLLKDEIELLEGHNFSLFKGSELVDRSTSNWISKNSGVVVEMSYSKIDLGQRNGLRLRASGTLGSIEWIQRYPDEFMEYSHTGDSRLIDRGSQLEVASADRYQRFKAGHPTGFIESLANLYSDIHDNLVNGVENTFVSGIQEAYEFTKCFDRETKHWKHSVREKPVQLRS